jgi:hypothetical protein
MHKFSMSIQSNRSARTIYPFLGKLRPPLRHRLAQGQQIAPRTPHPELQNCLQLNGFGALINAFGSGTRRQR